MIRLSIAVVALTLGSQGSWANERINFQALSALSPPPHPKSVKELNDLPSLARDRLRSFRDRESESLSRAAESLEQERAQQRTASYEIDRISEKSRTLRCKGGQYDGKTVSFYVDAKFGYHWLGPLGGVHSIKNLNEWIKSECGLP